MFIQFAELLKKTVFKHLKLFLVEFQSCFCIAKTLASLLLFLHPFFFSLRADNEESQSPAWLGLNSASAGFVAEATRRVAVANFMGELVRQTATLAVDCGDHGQRMCQDRLLLPLLLLLFLGRSLEISALKVGSSLARMRMQHAEKLSR